VFPKPIRHYVNPAGDVQRILSSSANKTTPPAEKPHPVWVIICGQTSTTLALAPAVARHVAANGNPLLEGQGTLSIQGPTVGISRAATRWT
jgi:hypothetical protein